MAEPGEQAIDTPSDLAAVDKPQQPPTVLVVDDDRAVREVLSAVLREEGYGVRQADGAEAALQVVPPEQLQSGLCAVGLADAVPLFAQDGRENFAHRPVIVDDEHRRRLR